MPKICATAEETDLEDPVLIHGSSISWVYSMGSTSQQQNSDGKIRNYSRSLSAQAQMSKPKRKILKTIIAWSQHMEGHGQKKCVERCCEVAHQTIDHALLGRSPNKNHRDLEIVGELLEIGSQSVLKCLHLARIGRPDPPWTVNHLARSVTKWNRACDLRPARLITRLTTSSTVTLENQIVDCKLRLTATFRVAKINFTNSKTLVGRCRVRP